jgi:hypothetical protein
MDMNFPGGAFKPPSPAARQTVAIFSNVHRPFLVMGGVLKVALGAFFYGTWLSGIIGW